MQLLTTSRDVTERMLAQQQTRIDDFGTGYSSLSYLHRLPVDYLKVDGSFVSQTQEGQPNHPIVATIMVLGNQLGLKIIAEGIETPYQLEQLSHLGYTLGQGYLFASALRVSEVEKLLAAKLPQRPL